MRRIGYAEEFGRSINVNATAASSGDVSVRYANQPLQRQLGRSV
ncbi:hypothetical protein HYPGJ_10622 [Hyphomicrobium sp. GJ21]|nr:hypothetical protein HYPGJ_10622 [Hyphomicrobium sp. GJ21]